MLAIVAGFFPVRPTRAEPVHEQCDPCPTKKGGDFPGRGALDETSNIFCLRLSMKIMLQVRVLPPGSAFILADLAGGKIAPFTKPSSIRAGLVNSWLSQKCYASASAWDLRGSRNGLSSY